MHVYTCTCLLAQQRHPAALTAATTLIIFAANHDDPVPGKLKLAIMASNPTHPPITHSSQPASPHCPPLHTHTHIHMCTPLCGSPYLHTHTLTNSTLLERVLTRECQTHHDTYNASVAITGTQACHADKARLNSVILIDTATVLRPKARFQGKTIAPCIDPLLNQRRGGGWRCASGW